jgi:hypothetical protein
MRGSRRVFRAGLNILLLKQPMPVASLGSHSGLAATAVFITTAIMVIALSRRKFGL